MVPGVAPELAYEKSLMPANDSRIHNKGITQKGGAFALAGNCLARGVTIARG